MIHSLPIFKGEPSSPIDGIEPLSPDSSCSRCSHKGTRGSVCIPDEGEPGGLLVLDSYPTQTEAKAKRLLMGNMGAKLRQAANKAGMEVAYASALRCAPKTGTATEGVAALVPGLTSCLPYLANTIQTIKPRRIIALGSAAIYALTRSSVIPSTTREGFAWVHLPHGWVPVFYAISPAIAAKNKFLAKWLEEDFARAVRVTPSTLPPMNGNGWARLVITKENAAQALESVGSHRWTAVDCEWAGRPYDKDFKLLLKKPQDKPLELEITLN